MAQSKPASSSDMHQEGSSRRDFLTFAGVGVAAVGGGAVAWSFIDYLNPSADVLALASIEVNLEPIEVGQAITVKWRGKPVFIRHRSEKDIELARSVNVEELKDPQSDDQRVQKPEWLVMVGICTHLGCVPQGQKEGESRGEFGGWFCPCHGSHYDSAGRIRKGPAPLNLEIPEYTFLPDSLIKIG